MRFQLCIWLPVLLVASACSAKRYLPEGQRYYAGHRIVYSDEFERVPRALHLETDEALRPAPVNKVLASRPGVWLHHVVGETKKEKGLRHWLKYKVGDKPVYLSDVKLQKSRSFVEGMLRSEGFLRAEVDVEIDSSRYEARVIYRVRQQNPYRVSFVSSCESDSAVCAAVGALLHGGALQAGMLFSKTALERERDRIGNYFRSEGYFYFRSDLLRWQADSTEGNRRIHLRAALSDPLPPGSTDIYRLGAVKARFALPGDSTIQVPGDVQFYISAEKPYIKPEKISPFITLRPGNLYSLADQRITLRQLNRLDIFEFVNLRYTPDSMGVLQAEISAVPLKRQSISSELNLSTTSNNFTGPGLRLEYNNRNLFRGGEKLRMQAVGRYETQLSGERRGLTSFEIDVQASLLIPRASGLFLVRRDVGNVPRARYKAQYRLFQQADFYTQGAMGVGYGYEWIGGEVHFHDLRIIGFDYLNLMRSSERLEALLQQNILFRESFENQVILGPSYQYSYAPPWKKGRWWRWYFQGAVDFAGNILYQLYNVVDAETNDLGQYTLGNVPFSQFARFQIDPRIAFKVTKTSELVLRNHIGVGLPYQNSNALPFSRQFFVGGAQSMRAFQPRGLGPGTYFNPDQGFESFFDQTGDVLLEWNAEYRFGMQGYFQGAIFTDVGNVWLISPNAARPGGEFAWSSFVSQLAVSAGAGLRLDLSVLLLRFDLATPLRLPYLPEGERWVVDRMSLKPEWRRRNLLLNIAIGYPF